MHENYLYKRNPKLTDKIRKFFRLGRLYKKIFTDLWNNEYIFYTNDKMFFTLKDAELCIENKPYILQIYNKDFDEFNKK